MHYIKIFFIALFSFAAFSLNAINQPAKQRTASTLYGMNLLYETSQALNPLFLEAKKNNWVKAKEMAHKNVYLKKHPFWANAFKWYYLMSDNTQPFFVEFETFLLTNNDWPELEKIKRRAELALIREANTLDNTIISKWFDKFPPLSQKARLIYIKILQDTQKIQQAHDYIQKTWKDNNFTIDEEIQFLKNYANDLNPESHLKRAQRLMDDGQKEALKRLFKFIPPSYLALYEARMGIQSTPDAINAFIRTIPEEVEKDPGFLMQILAHYQAKGMNDEAQKILLEHQPEKKYQQKWENIRQIQARESMKEKRYEATYQLMKKHSYTEGEKYSDFEWFCGWISLVYLKNTKNALKHFERHLKSVKSSMSLGRSYYWLARTHDDMNNVNDAKNYYKKAIDYGWTFYGQLAAQKINQHPNLTPIKPSLIPDNKLPLVQFAQLLYDIKDDDKASLLMFHVNKSLTEAGQTLSLALLADKLKMKALAVRFGRDAQNKHPGIALVAYPGLHLLNQIPLIKSNTLDNALVHSLILQESRYDPKALSSAGAKGYMQLMNDTAKRTAHKNKIPFQINRIFDPKFNLTIGTHHVKELLDDYSGTYPIMLAGYNAGPTPAARWRQEFGDPLTQNIDIINWIESLTYGETRNYLQRVLENIYVYRTIYKMSLPHITNTQEWWQNWNILKN